MPFHDRLSSCKQLLNPFAGVCTALVPPPPPPSFLDPNAADPAHPRAAWGLAKAVDSMAQAVDVSLLCDRSSMCSSVSCR